MIVINLKDSVSTYDVPKAAKLVVTDYEIGSYEGSGDALVLFPDNTVEHYGLGHCSCYGPFDCCSGDTKGNMSLDAFRAANQEVTCGWPDKLAEMFLALVKAEIEVI